MAQWCLKWLRFYLYRHWSMVHENQNHWLQNFLWYCDFVCGRISLQTSSNLRRRVNLQVLNHLWAENPTPTNDTHGYWSSEPTAESCASMAQGRLGTQAYILRTSFSQAWMLTWQLLDIWTEPNLFKHILQPNNGHFQWKNPLVRGSSTFGATRHFPCNSWPFGLSLRLSRAIAKRKPVCLQAAYGNWGFIWFHHCDSLKW